MALRRLLSLDYVIDQHDAPWLPTDDEKVAAFTAAGVPRDLWQGRVYAGTDGSRRRHFVHRLALALRRPTPLLPVRRAPAPATGGPALVLFWPLPTRLDPASVPGSLRHS